LPQVIFIFNYSNKIKATFHAPFSKLGQSPEACSSYTFPRTMGIRRATDILVFNRQLTAQEALDRGIVTEVILAPDFNTTVWSKIESFSKLPKNVTHKN
jgi:Delta3-Delta2-enoyl-CoA isomerase